MADRKKATMDVEPIEFDATTTTMLMSSEKMCGYINSIFSSAFADFAGSCIQLNSQGAANTVVPGYPVYPNPDGIVADVPVNTYYATLFFRPQEGTEGTHNLIRLDGSDPKSTNGNTFNDQLRRMINISARSRSFDLNQDTKDILEEFMYRAPFQTELNKDYWNRHVVEVNQLIGNSFNAKEVAHVKVAGLSLNALMAKTFGEKDENGDDLEYLVVPFVPPTETGMSSRIMFQVSRLNSQNLSDFVKAVYGSPLAATYVSAR